MTNPFIRPECPDCKLTTGGCGNHGTVLIPTVFVEPVPMLLFYCSRCGAPQYTREGFCGGCHPGK